MRKLVLVVASIALAAWIGFAAWPGGSRNVAMAELRQALEKVTVVHIAGEKESDVNGGAIPLAFHEEKWIRFNPLAFYEKNTPAAPGVKQTYVWAGNADRTYWYFPDRNRVTILNGKTALALEEEMLQIIQPSGSQSGEEWKLKGRTTIDGRDVLLLASSGDIDQELAIDPVTKLAYRYRQLRGGQVTTDLRFEYDVNPPAGVFDWQPPTGVTIVDKRRP